MAFLLLFGVLLGILAVFFFVVMLLGMRDADVFDAIPTPQSVAAQPEQPELPPEPLIVPVSPAQTVHMEAK